MVEGHGHQGAVNVGEDLVLIVRPLGKARQEVVHALVEGVVDVRTVLVDKDAVFVQVIVGVARNMIAALEHGNMESSVFGQTAPAYPAPTTIMSYASGLNFSGRPEVICITAPCRKFECASSIACTKCRMDYSAWYL